jgi:methylated-DNA-[protein]-cysteine S-methyltransferase
VCQRIEPDLVASAVGEAGPETFRQVRVHLDHCRTCRADFERYRTIEGAVAGLRGQLPPSAAVALARERLESRLLDVRSRLLSYRIFPSPLGEILIARSELGVVLVEYLDRATSLRASRLGRMHGVEVVEDGEEIEALYRDFLDYLDGRPARLREWPLDLRLCRSDFHRAVLRATAAIPPGAVVSYTRLAREVGRPRAVRAVAQALRWNPVPVAIPCHRVIGASGALTGYAGGGTGRKQRLLAAEGVPLVRAGHDFAVTRDAMYVLMPGTVPPPSCPLPERSDQRAGLFGSGRAEAAGFAPCTTCRPDLHPLHEVN